MTASLGQEQCEQLPVDYRLLVPGSLTEDSKRVVKGAAIAAGFKDGYATLISEPDAAAYMALEASKYDVQDWARVGSINDSP